MRLITIFFLLLVISSTTFSAAISLDDIQKRYPGEVLARNLAHDGFFDCFDSSLKENTPPILADAARPGETIDLSKLAGKIVVVQHLEPEMLDWNPVAKKAGIPGESLVRWKRLYDEFSPKGIQFILVWRDYSRTMAERINRAKEYADKHQPPGIFVIDSEKYDLSYWLSGERSKGAPCYEAYLAAVRDEKGNFVYYTRSDPGFKIDTFRLMLERLLNADIEVDLRRNQPGKSKTLPIISKTPAGLVYRDDFDSYKNSYSLRLEPCWGFDYKTQARLDSRLSLEETAGRGGGKAASLDRIWYFSAYYQQAGTSSFWPVAVHKFPSPLKDGTISFWLKLNKKTTIKNPTPVDIAFRNENGFRTGVLRAIIVPGKTGWVLETEGDLYYGHPAWPAKEPTAIIDNEWTEISVVISEGKLPVISVAGVKIGKLTAEDINSIEFDVYPTSAMLLDDFELRYNGNADNIAELHKKSLDLSAKKILPSDEAVKRMEEAAMLRKPYNSGPSVKSPAPPVGEESATRRLIREECIYTYRNKPRYWRGELPAILADELIPRDDINSSTLNGARYSFDHPLPTTMPLILERADQPGDFFNADKELTGKPFVLVGATMEDYMWGYEQERLITTTRKAYDALYKKYGDKITFVVIRGNMHHYGGYGGFAKTYEEARDTFVSWAKMTKLPGILLMDTDAEDTFRVLGIQKPLNRSTTGGGVLSVFDTDHRLVFNSENNDYVHRCYWNAVAAIERVTNKAYDISLRKDFTAGSPIEKFSKLPVEKANIQIDDFESYKDDLDWKTQPRWGFNYKSQSELVNRSNLAPGQGRGNSQAIRLNGWQYDWYWGAYGIGQRNISISHVITKPLSNGSISMWIKRGPRIKIYGKWPQSYTYEPGIIINSENGKPAFRVSTRGEWEKEIFCLKQYIANTQKWEVIEPAEQITMPGEDWIKITITITPLKGATVIVDGKTIGNINIPEITALSFDVTDHDSTFLDDIEVKIEE